MEGLEVLTQLSELHVAHQRLPEGEKLLFDPRTLSAICVSCRITIVTPCSLIRHFYCLQGSLNVLNVSGNNLDSLSDLQSLTELTHFSACNNLLTNMKDLNRVFTCMNKLAKLELSGNPLCQKAKYRDRVITMGMSIGKGENTSWVH